MFGIIFGALIGFLLFTLATHPKSRINKKLPDKKIRNVQLFPRINVSTRNRIVHVHHWMFLTPILLFIQNFTQSNLLHGFLIGGILQGLMFKDRFKLIFKNEEYHQVKKSSMHIPLIGRLRK